MTTNKQNINKKLIQKQKIKPFNPFISSFNAFNKPNP